MAALQSMTGFARSAGTFADLSWTWELKSVNGRGLDLRMRLPNAFDQLDPLVRQELNRNFKRGSFQIGLQLRHSTQDQPVEVNEELLAELLVIARSYSKKEGLELPRIDQLMALRGVVESRDSERSDEEQRDLEGHLRASLREAIDGLKAARQEEGARLLALLSDQLDQIQQLTGEASELDATQPAAIKQNLSSKIAELLDGASMTEERLAQEAALLAVKADVREELDRLRGHVVAARGHLTEKGPVGRKLDFLCQEFNREANTLCSKSSDMELTRVGLALKTVIDQFREQVQNVE